MCEREEKKFLTVWGESRTLCSTSRRNDSMCATVMIGPAHYVWICIAILRNTKPTTAPDHDTRRQVGLPKPTNANQVTIWAHTVEKWSNTPDQSYRASFCVNTLSHKLPSSHCATLKLTALYVMPESKSAKRLCHKVQLETRDIPHMLNRRITPSCLKP